MIEKKLLSRITMTLFDKLSNTLKTHYFFTERALPSDARKVSDLPRRLFLILVGYAPNAGLCPQRSLGNCCRLGEATTAHQAAKPHILIRKNKCALQNQISQTISKAVLLYICVSFSFFLSIGSAFAQTTKPTSNEFIDPTGLTIERLIELGFSRHADLLAARQRLAIAEGRVVQSGLRPNPTLSSEFGSTKILGGENETDFSVGVSQTIELGGKRSKRIAVAKLELAQARADVSAIERQYAAIIRASYSRAISAGRQLDSLEKLIIANQELIRVTEARLKEGDVAPLDVNIVRVELERLKTQTIRARADLETEIINLKTLIGAEQTEALRIAPQSDKPPRFEMSLSEITEIALRERQDLQSARIGEQLGTARIKLAESQATPNLEVGVNYKNTRQVFDLPESLGVDSTKQKDNEISFGISIDLPFFNRNQGEVASATAERIQAQRQREFLEATIKRDVAIAYRRYKASAETLVIYASQILKRAEENLNSVRAAYNLGEFSVFDVINEQRRLIENETGYNEALRDYYAALAELENVLGAPLPANGFAPLTTSVLPDEGLLRFTRNDFLKPKEGAGFTKPALMTKPK